MYAKEDVDQANGIYDTIEPSNYVTLALAKEAKKDEYCKLMFGKDGTKKERSKKQKQIPLPELTEQGSKTPSPPPPRENLKSKLFKLHKNQPSIKSVRDIPDDISSLSVDEMVQCLKVMNLQDLVSIFKEHQINGKLLQTLDENILVQDLKIKGFKAKKLLEFAQGEYRPR